MRLSVRLLLVILIMTSRSAHALELQIANDLLDMMIAKNIGLRLKCTGNEEGIIKRGLCFSVDNPKIVLTSWKASLRPIMVFNERFKKSKKTFLSVANFYVLFQIDVDRVEYMKKYLMEANIYVSGFVVHKNGCVKPFNLMTPLVPALKLSVAAQPLKQDQILVEGAIKPSPFIPTGDFDKEHEWGDRLEVVWKRFVSFLGHTFTIVTLIWLYAFLIALLLALVLRRYCPWLYFVLPVSGLWQKELQRLLTFLWIAGTVYFASFFIVSRLCIYVGAALCFVGMCYACSTAKEDYFLGRLKGLIGFVLGVLVFPLIVQAYLLWGM